MNMPEIDRYGSSNTRTCKFQDPVLTADGTARAVVPLSDPRTLWFNTGTLCNIACTNCYIESSPRNDSLVYITAAEVRDYLAQIRQRQWPVGENRAYWWRTLHEFRNHRDHPGLPCSRLRSAGSDKCHAANDAAPGAVRTPLIGQERTATPHNAHFTRSSQRSAS